MSPRYKKVFRDIANNRTTSVLLLLALVVGVFAVGTMLNAFSVLRREMGKNYLGSNPAHASIRVEHPISASESQTALAIPGVLMAEGRSGLRARMRIGDEWRMLLLFVVEDFANVRMNVFLHESGSRFPGPAELLVERSAYRVMKNREGDALAIRTAGGPVRTLRIAGTVFDPGLAPAWQEETGYGYVSTAALPALGEAVGFYEMRITVRPGFDVRETAGALADELVRNGHPVHEIQIPPPAMHPHQGQMTAVLTLFIVFAFLLLVLCSLLVASAMATLMKRQVREIGIMKAVGARTEQVSGVYVCFVLSYALGALAVAIPLARITSSLLAVRLAGILNLNLYDRAPEVWSLGVQVIAGLVFPLAAAFYPVWRAGRISVRETLDARGVQETFRRGGIVDLVLRSARLLKGPWRMSVRNSVRARARLLLSAGLLAVAGALFLSALFVARSWDESLRSVVTSRLYDLEIRAGEGPRSALPVRPLTELPSVRRLEAWVREPAAFAVEGTPYAFAHTYPDQGHGSFAIMAGPPGEGLLQMPLIAGSRLEDIPASITGPPPVALNHLARALSALEGRPVRIGDVIELAHSGRVSQWRVTGFVEDLGSPATAYVRRADYERAVSGRAATNLLRIAFTSRKPASVRIQTTAVESLLDASGSSVEMLFSTALLKSAVSEHMFVFIATLISISVLTAVVGLLGLMSGMGMSVLDRTREIGVMRCLGARPGLIRTMFLGEALIGAVLGGFAALPLSIPLAYSIGVLIGNMAFRTTLQLTIVPEAILLWAVLISVGSLLAGLIPANSAARLTIREALAYEG